MIGLLLLLACRTPVDPEVTRPPGDPAAAWGALLAQVVTADGYVDYDRLEQDREVLSAYLARGRVDRVPSGFDPAFAWWLNLYNATALHLALELGRPASVDQVAGLLPGAFYRSYTIQVGHDRVSLQEIFDERLRHRRMDHRVHAAVNHATRSSAPLRPELFDAARLYDQLDDQATRWLDDPVRGVAVADGVATFPAVFEARARDFRFWTGGRDPCAVAADHASPPLADALLALSRGGCPRRFRPDDRRLNHRSDREGDRDAVVDPP